MEPNYFNDELTRLHRGGDLSGVVSWCQNRLLDLRKARPHQQLDVALVLEDMARAYSAMGKNAAAISATLESIAIYCSDTHSDNADCIRANCNLAALYRREGRFEEGAKVLTNAKAFIDRSSLKRNWNYSNVMVGMARIHGAQRAYKSAEWYLLTAAKARLEEFGYAHPKFGDIYYLLGQVYLRMGRRVAARSTVRKAVRIYRLAEKTEDPYYTSMLAFLANIESDESQ